MQGIRINRLGHQGDGIADGPIFVPRALPGETVRGVVQDKTLTELRVDTPSPDRVQPPCPHYKSCGGCALQHASDRFVADWKTEIVQHALAAHGIKAKFREIVVSPPGSRRRATLAARRTKKGVLVGFHARASETITEIPQCQLLRPAVLAARDAVAALAQTGLSRKGALAAAITETESGIDIAVTGGKPLDEDLRGAFAEIADRFDLARVSWGDETIVTRRVPVLRFGDARVAPPPGAFLQATLDGELALLAAVENALAGTRKVVDLFSGCGTFALPVAQDRPVHAVEGDRDMLSALDQGWRHATGLKQVTTEARDLFRNPLVAEDLRRFDGAAIDPPRAGAEAQTEALAHAQIPQIAFVSCNPVTFARDAKTLINAGYRLDWVQVVDQFRWSPHVELVACFAFNHIAGD